MIFRKNKKTGPNFGESETESQSGSSVNINEDIECEVSFEWKALESGDFADVETPSAEEAALETIQEAQSEKTKLKSEGKTVLFGLAAVYVLASLMGRE